MMGPPTIFLHLILYLSLSLSLSAFSPIDNFLISCGSSTPSSSFYNRRFLSDDPSFNPNSPLLSSSSSTSSRCSFSPDQIYRSARVFGKPSKYSFRLKDPSTHIVRLHFYPPHPFNQNDAVFHVLVDGYVLLTNFSVSSVHKTALPLIREYFVPVSSNNKLVITFVPADKGKLAFVSAIEVISAPKDLIPDRASLLKGGEFVGLTKHAALEIVHRVNVGGPKITPFNDTLWRTWVPDDGFFKSGDVANRVFFGGRINYQFGGATREVGPDFVYNTARVISSHNASVPQVNMTWEFPVFEGYKYLVRLHFCDIASIALYLINFNVYANGYLAYERLDLSSFWYALAAPMFADFVVDGDASGVLSVSIGPSNESIAYNIDGILNGVEIMKMNNSVGSLDGEVCGGMVLKSWQGGNVGILVPLVAVVCLMLILSGLLRMRTVVRKDPFAWTKLPTDVPDFNLKHGNQQSNKSSEKA